MTFTRTQFDAACKAFLASSNRESLSGDEHVLRRYSLGWSWHEPHVRLSNPGWSFQSSTRSKSYPRLGYLARTVSLPATRSHPSDLSPENDLDDVIEAEDDATLPLSMVGDALICQQYVVYSPTFRVPAFYFSIHHNDGAPLALSEIISTPLFRSEAFPDAHSTAHTTFDIQDATTAFSLLSQGEHPTTGMPCWYLHPCHTEEVVGEIMREVPTEQADRDLRWLEAWFMVVGNAIDWRAGQSGA